MDADSYLPRLVDSWLDLLLSDVPGVFLIGPRGCGKTTTALRFAATTLRLDQPAVRAAVAADPDAVLDDADSPVLVDEWQYEPSALAAAKRLIDERPGAGRFLFTGSVTEELGADGGPATGRFVRVPLWGLTQREIERVAVGPTFFDRVAASDFHGDLALPPERPTTSGYVDRALRSGFPEGVGRASERTRSAWIESYVDHLVGRDASLVGEVRAPRRLRRYLRAVAASTAGSPTLATLIEAADVSRDTAVRFDHLLERLFVTDQVPAWSSNRLTRVTARSKRYLCDPAIAASLLGADRRTIMRDADLLGRIIDTFVAAQLRPELRLGERAVSMFHVRQESGRREIDLVLERTDGAVVAVEVKAATSVDRNDARHLAWLGGEIGRTDFKAGIVFYTGSHVIELGERIWAVPVCGLWGPVAS